MRTSTRSVPVVVEKSASFEEIVSYTVFEDRIIFWIEYYDQNNNPMHRVEVELSDQYFELLMSDSPDFAPGKPEGTFRKNDLWSVFDLKNNA